MSQFNRREFLSFLGVAGLMASPLGRSLAGSSTQIPGVAPTLKDQLILASGLSWYTIASWGDAISAKDQCGFNNDYLDWVQLSDNELILWTNYEYPNPLFVSGPDRTKANIDLERYSVGGGLMVLERKDGKWSVRKDDPMNRRIHGATRIPFAGNIKVSGRDYAIGTMGNCAGGKTPWNTFLTCEENYQDYYGDRKEDGQIVHGKYSMRWDSVYSEVPEHYGWVVEVDPKTGQAKKHTTLGRMAHECATCATSSNGNVVVYTGDDKNDEHLYKFVSSAPNSLEEGTLYVANLEKGEWIPLILKDARLAKVFKTQTDIYVQARKAAKIVSATPLDRPEDIEVHPKTGDVYVTLTNNKPKKNYHGQILRLRQSDHSSLKFQSDVYMVGGMPGGFSAPDNISFDRKGNLWVCTDISGSSIGKGPYEPFGNNGLFVVPVSGPQAGIPVQVASAPKDAELTGIKFSPDYKTMFLSVQHPGERTKDKNRPTSTWPTGTIPKPSIVAIQGPLLERMTL